MADTPGVGLRALPRSLDPLEDESLRGYLLRLAHLYGAAPSEIAIRTGLVSSASPRNTVRIPMGFLHDLDEQRLNAFARVTDVFSAK